MNCRSVVVNCVTCASSDKISPGLSHPLGVKTLTQTLTLLSGVGR